MKTPVINLPKIEPNIPIPERSYSRVKWRDLFLKMKRGDSFPVETESERCCVIRCAAYFRQRPGNSGFRVVTRKVNGSGFRVWRIK